MSYITAVQRTLTLTSPRGASVFSVRKNPCVPATLEYAYVESTRLPKLEYVPVLAI